MSRLNQGQRIVAIVGLGVALFFVGVYLSELATFNGWTAYAPLTKAPNQSGRLLTGLEDLFLWLGLVAVWVLVAVFVLQGSRTRDRSG
jgi:hypothetical protein